jgi:hypothetical protein
MNQQIRCYDTINFEISNRKRGNIIHTSFALFLGASHSTGGRNVYKGYSTI